MTVMNATTQQPGNLLTIGELSKRTGITTHTLRIWEKRHGAPQAIRLPSGHRRYPQAEVERLKTVAQALKLGFRAGKVVGGTPEELNRLLGLETSDSSRVPSSIVNDDSILLNQWIQWIADYDEENLEMSLHYQWGQRGPLEFVIRLAAPLVHRIGQEWQDAHLSVAQEHFATGILNNFLASRWRKQNDRKDGSTVVLTTLPGESHLLGLQMCATVISVTDWKIISLGLDVPEEDIITTVERLKAPLLCVSVSEWYTASQAKPILWRLRKRLGKHTEIIAGGGGAPQNLDGIEVISGFNEFYQQLTDNFNS
jgi:methanogenic corrinoid protein MtbC1/predicted DNA-binding transcriptional regulator AlpA